MGTITEVYDYLRVLYARVGDAYCPESGEKLEAQSAQQIVQTLLGKKVMAVIKEKKLAKDLPEDLTNLIKRHIEVMKHLEGNHHDMVAKRGTQLTESKIKRLVKYYKKKGVLAEDWRYNKQKAKLFIE